MGAFDRTKVKEVILEDIVSAFNIRNKEPDIFKNTLDCFGAVLDAKVLSISLDDWVNKVEIPRASQKSFQNILGIIHQKVLGTVDGWRDMETGEVVDLVSMDRKVIAEIKNKHNTTKGNHKIVPYFDLHELITNEYEGFTGYYVEILPKSKKTYDKEFTPSNNKGPNPPANPLIRQIDGRSFYALVTGEEDALDQFYEMFPEIVDEVLKENFEDYKSVDLGVRQSEFFNEIFETD